MRVLIAGGRDFNNLPFLEEVMGGVEFDSLTTVTTVISGTARGADQLGERWAESYNIPVEKYPALWGVHGRAAGHIRNQLMLDDGKPDLVIVFPGGEGSKNMVRKARKAGVETRTPGWEVS